MLQNFLFILGFQQFDYAMFLLLLFCYCPQVPKALLIFFHNLIFSVFRLAFYWVILKFTDDIPSHFYFADKSIWGILILVIFSALEFPFISISLLRFPMFPCYYQLFFFFFYFTEYHNSFFKTLAHSNIWIISWFISVEFLYFWDWVSIYQVILYPKHCKYSVIETLDPVILLKRVLMFLFLYAVNLVASSRQTLFWVAAQFQFSLYD